MFLDKLGLFHSLILVISPGKKLWLLSVLRPLAGMGNEYYPTFTHTSIQWIGWNNRRNLILLYSLCDYYMLINWLNITLESWHPTAVHSISWGMHLPFWNVFEKKDVRYRQTNVWCLYRKVIPFHHAGVVMRVLSGRVEDNLIFKATFYKIIGQCLWIHIFLL